ncbi:MAG: hypothetical protein FWC35_02160 [Proteobacteria bacterium]|nr:hypothetical protein [Pseudomonadota bacterium]
MKQKRRNVHFGIVKRISRFVVSREEKRLTTKSTKATKNILTRRREAAKRQPPTRPLSKGGVGEADGGLLKAINRKERIERKEKTSFCAKSQDAEFIKTSHAKARSREEELVIASEAKQSRKCVQRKNWIASSIRPRNDAFLMPDI